MQPDGDIAAPPTPPRPGGFRGAARLGQKITLTVGSNGVGTLLGFVALLAVGRYYAPGAYGSYIFAVSLVGLFGNLFQVGFKQAHQREVARGVEVSRALGVYARVRGGLGVLMVLVFLGTLWLWYRAGGGFTDATDLRVVLIILASWVVSSGRRMMTDTWLGEGRVARVEVANFVDTLVYAASVALIGFGLASASGRYIPVPELGAWVADVMDLPARATGLELAAYVALGHFLGKVAATLLSLYWWLRDGTHVGPWDGALAAEYRRFALPVALTVVLALVLQHSDVLMLGYFWTPKQVGWLGAAQRIANVAILANVALRGLLMPYFAHLLARGDDSRALAAFKTIERYLLVAVVPLALSMLLWAEEGLHIFVGNDFLGAAPALMWLAGWAVVSAMNMPVRTKHMAAGHTDILVRVSVLNVAANLVLNLLLIPQSILGVPLAGMAAEGAAMATFLSSLLAYAYNRWSAWRRFGIPLGDTAQLRVGAAGVVLAAAWWGMRLWLPATAYDRVWELMAVGVLGGVVYLAVLLAVRGVGRGDLRALTRAVHPRSLADEFRDR